MCCCAGLRWLGFQDNQPFCSAIAAFNYAIPSHEALQIETLLSVPKVSQKKHGRQHVKFAF